jgi:hypothetical protein
MCVFRKCIYQFVTFQDHRLNDGAAAAAGSPQNYIILLWVVLSSSDKTLVSSYVKIDELFLYRQTGIHKQEGKVIVLATATQESWF